MGRVWKKKKDDSEAAEPMEQQHEDVSQPQPDLDSFSGIVPQAVPVPEQGGVPDRVQPVDSKLDKNLIKNHNKFSKFSKYKGE